MRTEVTGGRSGRPEDPSVTTPTGEVSQPGRPQRPARSVIRRRLRRGHPGRSERGAVSAEAALVLPVLVAVTLGLVWLVALAAAQVRVVDAARETVRFAARGEPDRAAEAHGGRVAPRGTRFTIERDEDLVEVRATTRVAGPGGLFRFLPSVEVEATAVAAREPG